MPLRAPPFGVRRFRGGAAASAPDALPTAQYAGVLTSIDEIDRAAAGRGLISVEPEGAIIRRIPLVANVGGTLAPALAIEMLRVALGAPAAAAARVGGPRSQASRSAISSRPPRPTAPSASTSRRTTPIASSPRSTCWRARFDPAQLQQKLVLIGVTGVGLLEDKNTPLGVRMPGVEIHAQLLENLFDGTLLTRPSWAPRLEALVFLLLGALLVVATPRWKPRYAAMLAIGVVAAAAGVRLPRVSQRAAAVRRGDAGDRPRAAVRRAAAADARGGEPAEEVARARRAGAARGERPHRRRARRGAGESRPRRCRAPTSCATIARIDLAATMIPAREVGGDLYDFFRLDERRLFFLVGDVAGKGLSASIFMAVSKALYKSAMLRAPAADIGDIMTAANAEVSRDNPEMLFVTAFAGILDLESGELDYCNAGHDNPYLTHPGDSAAVRRIEDGGRAAAVRGRRFRLSRRTLPDARRRAALRRHRRRHRGAQSGRRACTARSALRDIAARASRSARCDARRGRRERCAPTWKRSSPAPKPPTTSRCWCCAGTGRRRPHPSPLRSVARQRVRVRDVSGRRSRPAGCAAPPRRPRVGTSGSRLPRPTATMLSGAMPRATSIARTVSARRSASASLNVIAAHPVGVSDDDDVRHGVLRDVRQHIGRGSAGTRR